METSECLKQLLDPSLCSGFRQRASASLTPANRLNLTCQRALKMGLRQLRVVVIVDGHAPNCPNQMSIVARGGLPVCEGRHTCGL